MFTPAAELRTGVVGLGPMGMHHVRAAADMPDTKLVAVVDVDRARADATASAFNCKALYDAAALVGEVDVATIATPPEFHAAAAVPLLNAGIACLIEKPLAMTEGDCAEILAAATKGNAVVAVGHVERFNPATEALLSEKISPAAIQSIAVRRFSPASGRQVPVDVVSDMMIHDLDIVLVLKGHDLTSTTGYGVAAHYAQTMLTFADGTRADLKADRQANERVRELQMITTTHDYLLDFMNRTVAKQNRATLQTAMLPIQNHDALRAEIADFLWAVRNSHAPRVTAQHALTTMRVAWAILDEMKGCQA